MRAIVDLSAVEANAHALKGLIGEECRLAAVVKANGYGLGAVHVALAALRGGATYLAVACVDEGIELRLAGIDVPVLVMGYVPPEEAALAVEHALTITLHGPLTAAALEEAAVAQRVRPASVPVHIKVDTGLGRYGCAPDDFLPLARYIATRPHLRLEGLMTHFAEADSRDLSYSERQLQVFEGVISRASDEGLDVEIVHAANSAAAIGFPNARLDMVRAGIILSGHLPAEHLTSQITLQPALSITATLSRVFQLCAGDSVGYGRTWTASENGIAGLVSIGYADGYSRLLSNRAHVLVHGQRCPVIGRVSMDQIAIDLKNVPVAREGDEVVLLGRQGDQVISADDLARWMGSISYEVLCGLAPRLPRKYIRNGQVAGHRDLLSHALAQPDQPHVVGQP